MSVQSFYVESSFVLCADIIDGGTVVGSPSQLKKQIDDLNRELALARGSGMGLDPAAIQALLAQAEALKHNGI